MPSPSIIVANDDPLYLEMIKDLLIEGGYPNVTCVEGAGAHRVIVQQKPDLVLLDISLANIAQGWKTLDLIRLYPSTARIPVIVCSTDGYMLREKVEHLRAKCCDILEKPFDLDDLLEKVRAIIGPPPASRSAAQ